MSQDSEELVDQESLESGVEKGYGSLGCIEALKLVGIGNTVETILHYTNNC